MAGALFYAARLPLEAPPDSVPPAENVAAGPVYPVFELSDMEGEVRDFAEWNGKHRILNFWATWCAPCRREIPLLKAFQDERAADGFQVIGIAVDFLEPVVDYAKEANFNYPILVGEQDAMAVAESSGVAFIGLPFTMLVAADGELIGTHMGEIHKEQLDEIATLMTQLERGEVDKDTVRAAVNAF